MRTFTTDQLDTSAINDFCRRWRITELALFGSAVRRQLRPDSDIDVLVSFESGVPWSLIDHARMQDELTEIFGRQVDLVTRRAVQRSHNQVRRREILQSAEPIYRAA